MFSEGFSGERQWHRSGVTGHSVASGGAGAGPGVHPDFSEPGCRGCSVPASLIRGGKPGLACPHVPDATSADQERFSPRAWSHGLDRVRRGPCPADPPSGHLRDVVPLAPGSVAPCREPHPNFFPGLVPSSA